MPPKKGGRVRYYLHSRCHNDAYEDLRNDKAATETEYPRKRNHITHSLYKINLLNEKAEGRYLKENLRKFVSCRTYVSWMVTISHMLRDLHAETTLPPASSCVS